MRIATFALGAFLVVGAAVGWCCICFGLVLGEDEACVKCYMADAGLLVSMTFDLSENVMPEVHRQVLTGSAEVNEGMLMDGGVAYCRVRTTGYVPVVWKPPIFHAVVHEATCPQEAR